MSATGTSGSSFRDQLATIDKRGRRLWVYPTKPKGTLHRWRGVVAIGLLVLLFAVPFVRIGGRPLLLLDIVDRQFYIFGSIFWPQDIYLVVLFLIALAVFIILFTAAWGRLFCGWICPQTVFMEMVFRKIEFWLEGSGAHLRQFSRSRVTTGKFLRRSLKHVLFLAISFLIGNLLLSYFIGTEALFALITSSPLEHLTGFLFMLGFTGLFYWIFSWFREQACTLVCPYGRLQSVLLDGNSIVVAYDFKRGDPRGPIERGAKQRSHGDCIDCDSCVHVCPTGIDIRNGTQLECVNCTACIDACNRIMARVGFAPGLIRYASHDGIANGSRLRFTPRMKLYAVILTALVGLLTTLLVLRSPVQATVLRSAGSLAEELPDGTVRNLYTITVVNKTGDRLPVTVALESPNGVLTLLGPELVLPSGGQDQSVFSIQIPKTALFSPSTLVTLDIKSGDQTLQTVRTTFVNVTAGKGAGR